MVGSWGVAGDVEVIEWGEKSCETEFEMNLENNFKLLSHHYSSHCSHLSHHLKTMTMNNANTRTMDDKQRVAKKGPRDINVNVSWATGKFFLFFLFLILLTTILNRLHVLRVMNDGRRTASGKKGKRFQRLLGQVSFFSPLFHFYLLTLLQV